ncbi:MAG: FecR domain-containing protein [Opitutaceae bacterium]|nr:FecR domain-containing protein [Verrucomicrobiales bacterium]
MKNLSSIFKNLAAFAGLAASFTLASDAHAASMQGKAEVTRLQGSAKYSTGGNVWVPLKVGTTLKSGAVIQTAADSTVDLNLGLNGPVVRVTPNTTLSLDKLAYTDTGADTVIETQLNLQSGRVLGNVKKLSAASRYEIKLPTGVAGIRGTDYEVTARPLGNGKFEIRVTSITGTLIGSAVVNGNVVTGVVNTGETWTPEGGVQALPPELLISLKDQISEAIRSVSGQTSPNFTSPRDLIIFVPATIGAEEQVPSPTQPPVNNS